MGRTLQIPGIVAAENLGFSDLPHKSSFSCYHLLGNSEADSILNRVNSNQPLTVIGTPVYDNYSVRLTGEDGFETPLATPGLDRTTFLVCTDPHDDNSGSTATLPVSSPVMADIAGGRKLVHWNKNEALANDSGSQYFSFPSLSGDYRPGSNGYATTNTYNQALDRDVYYPDGTVQPGGFNMHAMTAKLGNPPELYVQNGAVFERSATGNGASISGALSGSVDPSTTTVGAGYPSGTYTNTHLFHAAAFAVASALSESAVRECAEFIAQEVESRGVPFWRVAPDSSV